MKNLAPVLLLFVAVLACKQPQNASKPAVLAEAVTTSANDLVAAYKSNELAADSRFKGRNLVVAGTVAGVSETFGQLQGDLRPDDPMELVTVKCSFPESERSALSKLSKGTKAVFSGTGDGMTAGLYVSMANCSVN